MEIVPIAGIETEQKQFDAANKKNSPSELFTPPEIALQADVPTYKKKGKIVGRKRKYERVGDNGERPIKELVLFRSHTGKHWPGMSEDMESYYEWYYFKKPNKGKDGKDYEQHKRAYERGQRWIADDAITTAASRTGDNAPLENGDNGTPIYRKRASR